MSGAAIVAIGEFCETGSGGTPSRSNSGYYGGAIPWVKSGELRERIILDTEEKITELAIEESSAKIVPSGAILLAMYGATVGRLAILGVDAATNQAVCNIRPDPRVADVRYVFHGLQTRVGHFLARAAGGAQPNISQGIIRETTIPLPPLVEQRRIAAILDKADALRRKRKRALELLGTLTQSIFLDMFGGGEMVPLSQLVDVDDRINYGVVQPGDEVDSGIFLVRVSDIRDGRVDHSRLRKVTTEISKQHGRSVLKGNEILISCVGSIGDIALVTEEERGFNIARAVARVPISDILVRSYVAEYLRLPVVQRYFEKELRTVSQPTLNIKQISETLVPIPERESMLQFSCRAEIVERQADAMRMSANNSEILFTSLQHRAFSRQL